MAKSLSDVAKNLKGRKPAANAEEYMQDVMPKGGTISAARGKRFNQSQSTGEFKTPEWLKDVGDAIGEAFPVSKYKDIEQEKIPEGKEKNPAAWSTLNTQQALLGALPMLAGLAFGGTRGAAIGGKVGLKALDTMQKNAEDTFDREMELKKLDIAERKAQRDSALLGLNVERMEFDQAFRMTSQDIIKERERRKALLEKQELGRKQTETVKKDTTALRKEFNALPAVKDMGKIRDSYKAIVATPNNAAGDLSLIFQYMKMLDPRSTVREGEFANAQNATGALKRAMNLYNQVLEGTRLNPSQRKQFRDVAKALYQARLATYQEQKQSYAELVKKQGLDPKDVFLQKFEANIASPNQARVEALMKRQAEAGKPISRGQAEQLIYNHDLKKKGGK